eukprot:4207009-Prymnesium_polylepis.1
MAKVKLAEKLLERAEKANGTDAPSTVRQRIELADALVFAGTGGRAVGVLQQSLESSGDDEGLARHRLAPLLLRVGRLDDAEGLLLRYRSDTGAVMTFSRLLHSLATGRGARAALAAALEANAP